MTQATFEDLKGLTLKGITAIGEEGNYSAIHFVCEDGRIFRQYHAQDCCESVYVESIVGDLEDLVGSPILLAEETSGQGTTGNYESATWTFYKLATVKGYVDIRWIGTSNGYYSENVDFEEIK